jgi:hypothetical protein
MVKLNYAELTFDHLVVFEHDNTIFAAAKDSGDHTRLFLLFDRGNGRVYTRNGKANSWEILCDGEAATIRERVKANHILTYRVNGDGPRAQ